MRLRRRERNSGEASDSPAFSDLAFLLIIYFIVIAGFTVDKGLVIGLPPPQPVVSVVNEENILRYNLDNTARIIRGGEVIDSAEVESDVLSVRGRGGEPSLSLVVSPECPWQALVSFVDLTRRLDVKTFSFTKEESDI